MGEVFLIISYKDLHGKMPPKGLCIFTGKVKSGFCAIYNVFRSRYYFV